MPEEARRSSLHWRMWVLVVLGAVAGGGSAAACLQQGSYLKAALGALVCATCLGVIAWALDALTPPDLHASAAVREARARGGAVGAASGDPRRCGLSRFRLVYPVESRRPEVVGSCSMLR